MTNWRFRIWFVPHRWNQIRWAPFNLGHGVGVLFLGICFRLDTPFQLFRNAMGKLL